MQLALALLGLLVACNDVDVLSKRSATRDESPGALLADDKEPKWFAGWDALVEGDGTEYGAFPNFRTPKTIDATPMAHAGSVKLTDYWIRPTGYTTMWQHAALHYDDKTFKSDGVRWDTPTTWVPTLADGTSSGGNLTLMTQFGPDVPSYWAGATPLAAQTDWVFYIDYTYGSIMEIFDRSHFSSKSGVIKPSFGEVVAKGYYDALYWAPSHEYVVGDHWKFQGPARFEDKYGVSLDGFSSVKVVARYDTFTIPPARNRDRRCPATEFKDVIAVRHTQWWWDPSTQTSREDTLMLYMAKHVGWIYQLMNDAQTYDANNKLIQAGDSFLHMAPVGYIDQATGKRLCPHQFRDLLRPGQAK